MPVITFYRILTIIALIASMVTIAQADESRYVTDKLFVTLRDDMREDAKTVGSPINSGTQVKFIKEDSSSGYSLVELRNGTQGWLRTRYLVKEPTAAIKLTELEKRFNDTTDKSDVERLKELDSLREQNRKLTEQNQTVQRQLDDIRQASANVVKITDQNRELIEKNQILQSKVDQLEAIKEKYKDDSSMVMFLYGGFLVIITLLVKALLEHLQRKRSYSSWG